MKQGMEELVQAVNGYREAHPNATWRDVFDGVPNPYGTPSSLRNALRRFTEPAREKSDVVKGKTESRAPKGSVHATGLATPWKHAPMIDADPGGGRCPFSDCRAAAKEVIFTKIIEPGPPSIRERVLFVKCRFCHRRYSIYEKPKQDPCQSLGEKA